MLTFETCMKLKSAGFPQKKDTNLDVTVDYWLKEGRFGFIWAKDDLPLEGCRIPTLSELIEECGDGFENLYQYRATSKWACSVVESCLGCNPEGWDEQGTIGDTPEEAVANLYLALHNSK